MRDLHYKMYLIDGINDSKNFDFSILENICDSNVSIKRRNAAPGTLLKGTPFIITSQLSPLELFGEVGGHNLSARAMICHISDVELFPLLNDIIQKHNLPPYVENNLDIPDDIID